ncbi:MAG: chorismate synthase [bacterium]
MGNSFGKQFKISTWGESHGGGIGVVIDGCPAGLEIDISDIQDELNRRKPGQSHITTPRKEDDQAEILSGTFEGKTLGTPIAILIRNKDANPKDYNHLKNVYRPSHADYTYDAKYGIRNWQGGGRASARETIGRVAAGAIAKKLLKHLHNTEILAYVSQIHKIKAPITPENVTLSAIESNIVRCPDQESAKKMIASIETAKKEGNSLGGIIGSICRNVPIGLGEPVFDKLKADLAKGILSIPATMGIQFGSGFEAANMTAGEHNDPFILENNNIKTSTNHSGGIQGGISNSENILLSTVIKPTATISQEQNTITSTGTPQKLEAKGRHDPCVLPRAVVIIEAMIALVLADHTLRNRCAKI